MRVSSAGDIETPTAAEQLVLDSLCNRGIADFSEMTDEATRLRAAFLEDLIAGARPDWPKLSCPLRIKGARITGPVRSRPTSREGPGMTLLFWDCDFDSPVDFSGADLLTLRLVNCSLPAFVGISLSTKADLDLSGSHFRGVSSLASDLADLGRGSVHLNHARIGGRLLLSATAQSRFETHGSVTFDGARIEGSVQLHGALLQDCDDAALSGRSAIIGGNIELRPGEGHRCEVHGQVCLIAAHITGDLDCASARLINPDGRVLHCEDLVVESIFLSRTEPRFPFEASGRINFLSATVGGSFFLSNARLDPGPDYTGLLVKGGRVALNLQQIRVSNAVILFNIGAMVSDDQLIQEGALTPVEGWFLLAGAQMNTLIDDINTGWPAAGYLDLDGASYERIRHVGSGDLVASRAAWLSDQFADRQPNALTFRPQPYEQLTRVLRSSGLSREADAIAVEKIRMRLAAKVDSASLRVFPHLLMLISHHGYSTSRAIYAFLIFILLGAAMYTTAVIHFDQPFFPFEQEPEATSYIMPFGLGEVATAQGCPGLDTLHYALDFALPLINLGQDTFCRFVPEGAARWLWLALHSLYGVLGAALSAVLVLTLTGLLRRD